MKTYLLNLAVATDMLICALIPGGKERQTISGRLGSDFDGSIFELAVNWVFYKMGWWPDPLHCEDVKNTEEKIFEDENLTN